MVTLIGLVIGVSSIRYALDNRWEMSIYCLLVATIIDGIDGRVARLFNASSHFGAELDSLCDLVNFGLCPAILLYVWCMQEYEFKLISWGCVMLYVVCMAIRLARFNTASLTDDEQKSINQYFFVGVPAPVGALLALMPFMINFGYANIFEIDIREYNIIIDIYIVIIALLLPSRFPTVSLKKLKIPQEYLAFSLIIFAIIIILTVIYTWYVLPIAAIMYLCSIPVCVKIKRNHKLYS